MGKGLRYLPHWVRVARSGTCRHGSSGKPLFPNGRLATARPLRAHPVLQLAEETGFPDAVAVEEVLRKGWAARQRLVDANRGLVVHQALKLRSLGLELAVGRQYLAACRLAGCLAGLHGLFEAPLPT